MRTYTYKATLSKETHVRLHEFLSQQTLLYNCALQERVDCYRKTGQTIALYDQYKSLTLIRKDDEWFSKFHARSQRSALNRLDRAYKRFFAQGGFPRFKSRKRGIRSFDISQPSVKSSDKCDSIAVKGVGRLRWRNDGRYGTADIRQVRVVRYANGVYIQLCCDVEPETKGRERAIGVDVGVKERAVLSDGTRIPKRIADVSRKKRLQRRVARAQRGSNGRAKKVQALARECHKEKVGSRNHLHAITTSIVRNHGKYIAVEDIKTKNLTRSGGSRKRGLNRSILEQSWGAFAQQLEYKAASAGGQLVKVDPKNTTQKCSNCGGMPEVELTLKDRSYYCVHCGRSEDRDVNASRNILLEGLKLFDSGGTFPEVLAEGRTTDSVANRQHRNIVN